MMAVCDGHLAAEYCSREEAYVRLMYAPTVASVYDNHPADEGVEEEDRVHRQHLALVRNNL